MNSSVTSSIVALSLMHWYNFCVTCKQYCPSFYPNNRCACRRTSRRMKLMAPGAFLTYQTQLQNRENHQEWPMISIEEAALVIALTFGISGHALAPARVWRTLLHTTCTQWSRIKPHITVTQHWNTPNMMRFVGFRVQNKAVVTGCKTIILTLLSTHIPLTNCLAWRLPNLIQMGLCVYYLSPTRSRTAMLPYLWPWPWPP